MNSSVLKVHIKTPCLVTHDNVILEKDEEETDGKHVGLKVVGERHEADEDDDGDEGPLPLQDALDELAHAHELHDDGLNPHHVVEEDLEKVICIHYYSKCKHFNSNILKIKCSNISLSEDCKSRKQTVAG